MAKPPPDHARAEEAARAFPIDHAEYPEGLRDLRDAPRVVYVRGRVPARAHAVAVVGARAATPYGVAVATALTRDLVALGFAVVSGLARGIDAAAHRAAIQAGGSTVGVLPGGLDHVTPRHHAGLAEAILERGALLTEWASGPPVAPGVFVRRNRLIAALASAVVVVEAGETSGALSTALAARRLGRAVLAVPGDVDRPMSAGCLDLLRGGARLCAGAVDVLAALPPPEGATASRLLAALREEPCAADVLARRAGMSATHALAELLRLQWSGAAEACPGQRWRRVGAGVS